MFIQYDPAVGSKDPSVRRAINAYVAGKAHRNRRTVKTIYAPGTFRWVHQAEKQAENPKDLAKQREAVMATIPSIRQLEGSATSRVYPLVGSKQQGLRLPSVIDYYFQTIMPFDARALGLLKSEYDEMRHDVWAMIEKSNLIRQGTAAFALCTIPQGLDVSTQLGHEVLMHRGRLLAEITQKLTDGVDDFLIQATIFLMIVDCSLGFVDHAEKHIRGLEEIVKVRGGIHKVGSSIKGIEGGLRSAVFVALTLAKFALNTSSAIKSRSDLLHYPGLSASSSLTERFSRLPSGFAKLASQNILCLEVIGIIEDFDAWLNPRGKDVTASGSAGRSPALWRPAVPTGLSYIERSVCIALTSLADDLASIREHPAYPLYRATIPRIRTLLEDSIWEDIHLDCLLWICTVVVTPWKDSLAPEGLKFALMKKVRTRCESIRHWTDVKAVLQRFFWEDERGMVWEELWELLV